MKREPRILAGFVLFLGSAACADQTDPVDNVDKQECEDWLDEPASAPVRVVLENRRDTDVFLDSPNCSPLEMIRVDTLFPTRYDIAPEFGTWPSGPVAGTCEDLMAGEGDHLFNCGLVPPLRIIPGGRYTTEWPGLIRVPRWLPDACGGGSTGYPCEVERPASAIARYDVPARYSVMTIEVSCDPETCACPANDEGWCYGGGAGELEATPTTAQFVYPVEEVVIPFE